MLIVEYQRIMRNCRLPDLKRLKSCISKIYKKSVSFLGLLYQFSMNNSSLNIFSGH